jgi:hypothetical protein
MHALKASTCSTLQPMLLSMMTFRIASRVLQVLNTPAHHLFVQNVPSANIKIRQALRQ